jgi:CubicO group peptidase (beta-lactamase class C family)
MVARTLGRTDRVGRTHLRVVCSTPWGRPGLRLVGRGGWDNPTLAGAGEPRSTVRDLSTYLAANLGLEQSSLHDAKQLSHQRFHQVDSTYGVGLGWHIRHTGFGDVVEAHGATGGYWCYLGFLESRQVGVVVLTNTYNSVDGIGLDLLGQS